MCGIAGFLEQGQLSAEAAQIVNGMAAALAHRGPDDSGAWLDPDAGVALGHRRLAIIDTSPSGHQPMISASGRFVIVFNGEIYNFRELRTELNAGGGRLAWRGSSDTEVLLAAFDRWGVRRTLDRLNGMFAFAVWDRQARALTLARDPMGEKPLYYGSSGSAFLFGSELKSLRAYPQFRSSLDLDSLTSMLRYDYVSAPWSIWLGISKLEPGHYVEISGGGRQIGKPAPYWSLSDCAANGSTNQLGDGLELLSELDSLLKDAVAKRMVADVPLGAFLSGGIDSSLIVALMQAQSARPVRTFTIGFHDQKLDEAPYARAVAAHLGTDHTELYVTAEDAMDVIPKLPVMSDEPFGDSSQIPTFLVSAMARRDVTVALSGDGGDELFGGYSRYRSIHRIWNRTSRLPFALRKVLAHSIPTHDAFVPGNLGRAVRLLSAESFEALYRWKVSRIENPERLVPDAQGRASTDSDPIAFLADPRMKMMYWDALHFLPDNILTKVDRASMAVSLESRAPFLDTRVAEFAWRLPMSAKVNDREGKAILRQLLRNYLPTGAADRRKMGFAVPMASWLRGPLRGWAADLLSENRLSRQGILNVSAVAELWRNFLTGKPRHDRIVWNLLSFQGWLNQLDGETTVSPTIERH